MTSTPAFPGADISSDQDRAIYTIVFAEHAGPRRYFFGGGGGITVCYYEIGEDSLPTDAAEQDVESLQAEFTERAEALWAEFCESPECLGAGEAGICKPLVAWLAAYEPNAPDQQEQLDCLLGLVGCARYDDPEAQAIINCGDWSDFWPVIDTDGEYTGDITDSADGLLLVANEAIMIRSDEADSWASGWAVDREEGTAYELPRLELCGNAEWWQVFSRAEFDGIDESWTDEAAADLVQLIDDNLRQAHYRVESSTGQRGTCHGWNGANVFSRGGQAGVGTIEDVTSESWGAVVKIIDEAIAEWQAEWEHLSQEHE